LPAYAISVAAKITVAQFDVLINGIRELLFNPLPRPYNLRITEELLRLM